MNSSNGRHTNQIRLYESLGQIVVSFDILERTIESIIFCAINTSTAQARILFSSLTFGSKVKTMGSVLRELHTFDEQISFVATLNEFIERAQYCEERRNELVKSCWIPELGSELDILHRLQSDRQEDEKLKLDEVPFYVLEGFVVCLNSTIAYLHAFYRRLQGAFGRLKGYAEFNEYLNTQLRVSNDSVI